MAWRRTKGARRSDEGQKRPLWRRILKWSAVGLASLVGLVVLLVSAVLLLLHTDWGRAQAVRIGLSFLNDSIRGSVHVERLEGSVLDELAVVGAEIRDPEGNVVASVARIEVGWDPFALIDGRVVVHRVDVQEPRFVVNDEEGRVGVARAFEAVEPSSPEPPPPSEEPSPWVILVERLTIDGGAVAMDPSPDAPGVRDLTLDVAVRFGGGRLRWEGLELAATPTGVPVGGISVLTSGELLEGRVVIDTLRARVGESVVVLRGSAGPFDDLRADVRLERLTANLDELAALFPGLPLMGEVDVEGTVQGGEDEAVADLEIGGSLGRIVIHGEAARTEGEALQWELTLIGRDLTPGAVVEGVEPRLVADLDLRAGGRDVPPDGRAALSLDVLRLEGLPAPPTPVRIAARMDGPDAHVTVRSSGDGAEHIELVADASVAGLQGEGPPHGRATATWDIRGLDLRLVGGIVGMPHLRGEVLALRGGARGVRTAEGDLALDAAIHVHAQGLRLPEAEGARAASLRLDAAATWAGGEPQASLDVEVRGARGADASVGLARVSAHAGAADGVAAQGLVHVRDAAWGGRAFVESVTVPFDLYAPWGVLEQPPERPPVGHVAARLQGARFEDSAVASLAADFVVEREGQGERASGTLHVERARSGQNAVARLDGTVTARRDGETGRIRAETDLTAGGIAAGGARVGAVELAASALVQPDVPIVSADGTVEVRRVRTEQADIADATADFDLRVDPRARLPEGSVDLRARTVALGERTLDVVDASASLRGGVATVVAGATDGDVRLSVDATGTVPQGPRSPIRATLRSLRLEGPEEGVASTRTATLRYDPAGGVEVHDLALEGLGSLSGSVQVDGAWGRDRFDGRLRVDCLPIGEWVAAARRLTGIEEIALDDLDGIVTMDIATSGSASDPSGHGEIHIRDARVRDVEHLALDLTVDVEPGSALLRGMAWWKGRSGLALDVDLPLVLSASPPGVRWRDGGRAQVVVELDNVDLADLRPYLPEPKRGEPLAGTLRGRIDVAGPRDGLRGTVGLTAQDVALGPIEDGRLGMQVNLDEDGTHGALALTGNERTLARVTVDLPVNLARVAASPDPKGALIDGLSSPFSLRAIVPDLSPADLPYAESLSRDLRRIVAGLDLTVGGSLDEPVVRGTAHVARLPVGDAEADVHVELETNEDDLTASILVQADDLRLVEGFVRAPHAVGRLLKGGDPREIATDPRLLVALTAMETDLSRLDAVLPGVAGILRRAVYEPQLTASVVVRGATEGPEATVMLLLETPGARVPARQETIARSVQASVAFGPDGTQLTAIVDQGRPEGVLMLEGELGVGSRALMAGAIPPNPEVQAKVATRGFELDGLSSLLPSIFGPSRGTLTIDLTVDGAVSGPTLEGSLEARFDRLEVAAAGLRQDDTALRIDIGGGRVELAPIHWEHEGGTFDLSFAMEVPALDPARMTLDGEVAMRQFQLLRRSDLSAELTGDVTVAGTVGAPQVDGSVQVESALVSPAAAGRRLREVGPPEDVRYASEIEAGEGAPEPTAEVDGEPLRVALSVHMPRRSVHVRSDIIDVFVEGDLSVDVVGETTAVEGMIVVSEGTVELQGVRFTVEEESRVILGGGTQVDPRLQVRAHHDISDVDLTPLGLTTDASSKIILEVTGRASEPKLELSSDPPMDDTNIMSVLLFGAPMGGGGGDAAEQFRKGAIGAVVGFATGVVTQGAQRELGLDVLRVEGGEQSLADAEVTVGKRLTRDLLLTYRANLGAQEGENENEVRVDYRIIQGLHLQTRFGDAGRGALDLLYRWRY